MSTLQYYYTRSCIIVYLPTPTRFLNYAQGRSLLALSHKALFLASFSPPLCSLALSPPSPPPSLSLSLCSLRCSPVPALRLVLCVCGACVVILLCVCAWRVCRPSFSSPPYLYYLPSYKSRKLTPRPSLSYPQLILRFISALLSLLSDPSILFLPPLPFIFLLHILPLSSPSSS